MNDQRSTHPLPDGSVAVVEATGHNSSIVSRLVDGECVWGQVFSRSEDHAGQVAEVVADMTSRPEDFRRWWIPKAVAS